MEKLTARIIDWVVGVIRLGVSITEAVNVLEMPRLSNSIKRSDGQFSGSEIFTGSQPGLDVERLE